MVVVRSAHATTPIRPRASKGISKEIVALAKKWAKARGLPLAWVLATIHAESRGDPNSTKLTPAEDSVGLMQINYLVHAGLVRSLGLTRASLFDPDTNIMVGTLLMRQAYDSVVAALAGRRPPADLGLLTRLAYWGPARTRSELARGGNPAVGNPQATMLIVGPWKVAMAEISALV